jgi:transketolase
MFSEYARNAIRMAALMGIRAIFVFTHDSVGLGEDGPTHQPVEQTATLRLMPNLHLWRPCDLVETLVAWSASIERDTGPTALVLSRQNLAPQHRSSQQTSAIARGGYVLRDVPSPSAVIVATGSEVDVAMRAAADLADQGIAVRVVSMPCVEVFDAQESDYRDEVLIPTVPRVIVEAGATGGWYRLAGGGTVVGIDRFGESAPAPALFEHFGIHAAAVVSAVQDLVGVRA